MTDDDDSGIRVDGRAQRWAGQRERRRAEFVDAAIEAIAEHGAQVSTAQIADRAGVPRPRLYRHFDDKDDLRRAVVARVLERFTADLGPVWRPVGTPREMIDAAIETHVRWLTEHRELYRYVLDAPDAVATIKGTIAEHVAALLVAADVGLDRAAAEWVSYGLVAMVDGAANRWLDQPPGHDREALIVALSSWCLAVLDSELRAHGTQIDPDAPFPLG